MITIRIWSTAILGWCVLAGLAQAEPKADPREKLETVIPEAIHVLEAKDYAKFIKTFVAPEDLKKATEVNSFDNLAKTFGERKAPQLLEALKSVKDVEPSLSAEGNQAVYKLKEALNNRSSLAWKKVDKYWYLEN